MGSGKRGQEIILGDEKELFSGKFFVKFVFFIKRGRGFHCASILIKSFRKISPQICVLKFCEKLEAI